MLLTIYNLPENTRYLDVKTLIESKCGIKEMILDNLISWGAFMKVTVGLATEEDAAILVRKINGLFINGVQLHVEDVRKKKQVMDQPYYNTKREVSYQNHQNSVYLGQQNDQPRFENKETNANPQMTYYHPSMPSYGLSTQNAFTPYVAQPAVQYPTPQRMYQAQDQPHKEPLGFRSEGNATPWSHNQGRNNEPPKNSLPQRDSRWSPEHSRNNEKSQRPSRWGDFYADRDGPRRKSPLHDRRHERDGHAGTSRQAFDRDDGHRSDNRGSQRPNDRFAPKDNRNPKAPAFGTSREFERASFSNPNKPKQAKKNDQRRPDPKSHQPWAKPNPGSFKTQHLGEQTGKPTRKRAFEQNNQFEDRPKRFRLPILKEFKKPISTYKPKYTAEEYEKVKETRSETWRAQTASQIAKDMIDGKTITGVDHALFFKELKRNLRERLVGLCHPLMRHDGLYLKYRKKYKEEDDEKFMKEVMESAKIVEVQLREKTALNMARIEKMEPLDDVKCEKPDAQPPPAHATDVKVPDESKPQVNDGVFKIPLVPKIKTEPPLANDKEPKYTKSELSKFKRQKQQTKRIFQHESILLNSLDPKMVDALETESTILYEKFLEECHDPDSEEKELNKRLRTTVAEDFKRVVKVHVARRILNTDEPVVRVFCSPRMLNRSLLSEFLEGQGITAIKKASKHPMLLASCKSYDVHDRLCTAEPFTIRDRVISFRPLQLAGPPVKFTKEKVQQQRQAFINSQIDNSTTEDNEIKLMNDINKFQHNLDHESDNANNKTNDNIKDEKQSPNNTIDNIAIEDFTDDIDVIVAVRDTSVDDYKIVEDTIANINNKETEGFVHDGGNGDSEDGGNIDTSDEQCGENIEGHGEITADTDEENGGNLGQGEGDIKDGEEQVQDGNADGDDDCEDLEIGDIDEDDLEDY